MNDCTSKGLVIQNEQVHLFGIMWHMRRRTPNAHQTSTPTPSATHALALNNIGVEMSFELQELLKQWCSRKESNSEIMVLWLLAGISESLHQQ